MLALWPQVHTQNPNKYIEPKNKQSLGVRYDFRYDFRHIIDSQPPDVWGNQDLLEHPQHLLRSNTDRHTETSYT